MSVFEFAVKFFQDSGYFIYASIFIMALGVAIAIVVGLVIGLLQAVTSIQEQTLTFVPKIVALALVTPVLESGKF